MIYVVAATQICILNGEDMTSYCLVNPKEGETVDLYKPTGTIGIFPVSGRVTGVDENGFSILPYDLRKKEYGEEVQIELGKQVELTAPFGSFDEIDEKDTRTDSIRFDIYPIEILWATDKISDLSLYKAFYEQYHGLMMIRFQDILANAPTFILFRAYSEGLFGLEVDKLRAFAYLVGERDLEAFNEWGSRPEVMKDLKHMKEFPDPANSMFFASQAAYWMGRYRLDHGFDDGYSDLLGVISLYFCLFFLSGISYSDFFAFRDVVRYTVDRDLYEEFDKKGIVFSHASGDDPVTILQVYACYLDMKAHDMPDGTYRIADIIVDDPSEISRYINDPFIRTYHIDDSLACALVEDALSKGDRYAEAILAHASKK